MNHIEFNNSPLLSKSLRQNSQNSETEPWSSRMAPGNDEALFPTILFQMLSDASEAGFEDIVSWGKDPTAFNIHNKLLFESAILPKYFKTKKYRSFTRQLHNYGFIWIRQGSDKGGYSHKHFSREGREICNLLPQKPRKAIVVHSTPSQRQRVSDTAISPVSLFSVNDSESSGVQTSIFSGLTQPPPSSMSSLTSSVESNGIARLPWNRNGNYELPSSNGVQANLHSQSATIISSGSLDIEKVLSPISFHEELEPRTIEEMLDDTHEDEICDFC